MVINKKGFISDERNDIIAFLKRDITTNFPENMADSMNYIMNLPGKRLRPVLTLLVAKGFGLSVEEALPAAVSVEMFHNFTLIHDDIMDEAEIRRGQPAVHRKFGVNKAINTGDVMVPQAIDFLIKNHPEKSYKLITNFVKMAKEVMEGQQFDMDFENLPYVEIDQYLNMIRLKTSVLFGFACQIGAIIGNANEENQQKMYDFGLYFGLAFQIMDDYLDTFGDESFGKRIGGDIMLNKKTFLLVNAMKLANEDQSKRMLILFDEKVEESKIEGFKQIFKEIGIDQITENKINELHQKSIDAVQSSSISKEYKDRLIALGKKMLNRTI